MRDQARVVMWGAVLGALVGAAGGWAYHRYGPSAGSKAGLLPARAEPMDKGQLLKLALAVLAVIRQAAELR